MSHPGAKDYSTETLIEAIKGSGAVVSTIAKRLGCDWNTARKYINNNEEAQQAFTNEEETILDMCESAIYKSVQEGNTQDAKWILATKGKKRGFTERQEITGADGGDIQLNVSVNLVKKD